MDRPTFFSFLGALGSWLGGIAAHLLALILAPIVNKVCEKFFPPPPPLAPNLEASIAALAKSMDSLNKRVDLLVGLLVDPDSEMEFGVTFRGLSRRRRRRGLADAAVAPPG